MRQNQYTSVKIASTFFLFLILTFTNLSCVPYQASSSITTKPAADTKTFKQQEEETMDSWLNHQKSELIQQMGPPDRTTNDAKDGEILIYEQTVNFPNPYGPVTRMRMFYVQKDGTIYYWLCKGKSGY